MSEQESDNKAILYVLAILAILGGFYAIEKFSPDEIIPLTGEAVDPDLLLSNSRTYYKEHAYGRSISNLDQAIVSIRNIEEDIDEQGKALLEEVIIDLEIVKKELEADSLSIEDLNISYSEALNALTEAELKVTRALFESNHDGQAIVALKYGMMHLKNTLNYTSGAKKEYEIHIYEEIDSLLKNKSMPHDQMIKKLDEIMIELDSLIADNLHSGSKK